MAHDPHLACEAALQFEWPATSLRKLDFLMERLIGTILWQIKRWSKPKPSFVWFSRNQFEFAAKTFFLVFT